MENKTNLDAIIGYMNSTGTDIYTAAEALDLIKTVDGMDQEQEQYVADNLKDDFEFDTMDKVIAYLQGTCTHSIDSVVGMYWPGKGDMDLAEEDFSAIDNEIFNCVQCGWWCETSEMSDNGSGEAVCADCGEEESEEDDE